MIFKSGNRYSCWIYHHIDFHECKKGPKYYIYKSNAKSTVTKDNYLYHAEIDCRAHKYGTSCLENSWDKWEMLIGAYMTINFKFKNKKNGLSFHQFWRTLKRVPFCVMDCSWAGEDKKIGIWLLGSHASRRRTLIYLWVWPDTQILNQNWATSRDTCPTWMWHLLRDVLLSAAAFL